MRNKLILRIVSAALAGTVLCMSFAGCKKQENVTDNEILKDGMGNTDYVQQEYKDTVDKYKKDETVYINARPDGSVYQVKVTDWIHTDKPQVRVSDVSDLGDIVNVKTLTKPVFKDDKLFWDMDSTDLYYSGTTKKTPPVSVKIDYYLNGKKMTPDEIAGKKGDVKIVLNVESNLKKNLTVDGKKYTITCPMLFLGGTFLPEDYFSNISIDFGTAVSDGSKQLVFFAGIPGIDESLGLSELNLTMLDKKMYTSTYTITAHTENFELSNFMFAAVPFSAVSMGNGGLSGNISEIQTVLSDIEQIEKSLNGLNVDEIVSILYGDSNRIESILGAVSKASRLYNQNEKMLKVLAGYMTDDNLKKLDKLVTDLEKADMDAINKTLSDPKLQQLLSLLPQISGSLADISVLADDINDVMPIFQKLAADMEDPAIKKSIDKLPQTLKDLSDILNVLQQNRDILDTVSGILNGADMKEIQAIMNTADKYINADTMDEKQAKILAQRAKAWIEYGNTYNIFTKKAEGTTSSVLFTYKTDALKAPDKEENKQQEEIKKANPVVSWFKNLFS